MVFFKIKKVLQSNAFQKILKGSNCKVNKIWIDKGSECYNRSMKSFCQSNNTEMYLAHNEGKSFLSERFIRTLKSKTCKYMTSISKNGYIGKLDNIVNKYKNTYHSQLK